MSLTRFVKLKDVREKIKKTFIKPDLPKNLNTVASPLTKNYSLVGTAFDYLLRFYLQCHNQHCTKARRWVSEGSLHLLKDDKELRNLARSHLITAKNGLKTYLITKKLTDDLVKSTLYLARLDGLVRSGFGRGDLNKVNKDDITDLYNLISLVTPNLVKGKRLLLNPTFSAGSKLLGGADADFIIDDILVDIKTSMYFKFPVDYFNQLIGYYTLYYLSNNTEPLNYLAIYYARQGHMFKFKIDDFISHDSFLNFSEWFVERAKKENYPICKKA